MKQLIKGNHYYRVDKGLIFDTNKIIEYIDQAIDNGADKESIRKSIEISKDKINWKLL